LTNDFAEFRRDADARREMADLMAPVFTRWVRARFESAGAEILGTDGAKLAKLAVVE
jgi:hypothetical protein